jgi:hypothetical protein
MRREEDKEEDDNMRREGEEGGRLEVRVCDVPRVAPYLYK